MSAETRVVRVLENRALSLNDGEGVEATSQLFNAGDELELASDEAAQLQADGFVEPVK